MTALPYSSIRINEGAFQRHTDANRGPSVVFAFGTYSGGGLRLYDEDHSCTLEGKNCFILFDGARDHEVCKYIGARRSVMFFVTFLPDRLERHHWDSLQRWGYPMQECAHLLDLIRAQPTIAPPTLMECPEAGASRKVAEKLPEGLPIAEFPPPPGDEQHATFEKQERLHGFLPECADGAHRAWLAAPLDLSPCGLPYKENPIWLGRRPNLAGLSSKRRLRRRRVLRRGAWINLLIASLSWLSLGKLSSGDKAETLCMLLNGAHEDVLRWLEGGVRQQCPAGKLWSSSSLRRCRGLDGVFEFLGEDFYGGGGVSTPGDNAELATKVTEAKWISAETASLPEHSAVVDLRAVMPPELYGPLSAPEMLSRELMPMEEEVLSLPPLFMRERTLMPRHLRSGIFGGRRRKIFCKNLTEVSMRVALHERACSWVKDSRLTDLRRHMTLPHSMQFGDLLLPDDCEFDMSLDCKNFFYLLRVAEAAMKSTPIGWPVEHSAFRGLDLPAEVLLCDLHLVLGVLDITATLYLRSPAMGDLKTVEVAQAAHTTVLLKAGMERHEWMTLTSPCPTHGSWRGCYVDEYSKVW
eukprot:2779963-Amphidinium_carterae.3